MHACEAGVSGLYDTVWQNSLGVRVILVSAGPDVGLSVMGTTNARHLGLAATDWW
jgi:hypothetical protein